jgi:RHS repeat-associated protein
MAPSLALVYSSSAANGPLGVGWSIEGATSAISACNKTKATEGVSAAPVLGAGDSYCLDGLKLVPVPGKPEFRTEQDTVTRIVATGTGVPTQFTVYLNNGHIRQYKPVVSYPVNGGPQVPPVTPVWPLISETDAFGNSISYNYSSLLTTDAASGTSAYETVIAHIDYTATATAAAQRAIHFVYAPRFDSRPVFFRNGTASKLGHNLVAIEMKAPMGPSGGTQVAWRYNLAYAPNGMLGRNVLSQVQKVGSLAGASYAKSFFYTTSPNSTSTTPVAFSAAETTKALDANDLDTRAVDLNGDGLSDIVTLSGGFGSVYLESPSGLGAPLKLTVGGQPLNGSFNYHFQGSLAQPQGGMIDLHGAGAFSLIVLKYPATTPYDVHCAMNWTVTGAVRASKGPNWYCADHCVDRFGQPAAPNGCTGGSCTTVQGAYCDTGPAIGAATGLLDVTPTVVIWEWDKVHKTFVEHAPSVDPPSVVLSGDVDGDGLQDLVGTNVQFNNGGNDVSTPWVALSQKNGNFAPAVFGKAMSFPAPSPLLPLQLDGSGRATLFQQNELFSAFTYDPTKQAIQSSGTLWNAITLSQAGDFNGDGLTDNLTMQTLSTGVPIFYVNWNTGNWRATSNGFAQSAPITLGPMAQYILKTYQSPPAIDVLDLNRDGRDDLLLYFPVSTARTPVAELSNGDGTFTEFSVPSLPTMGTSKATVRADFDGDGWFDLLAYNPGQGNYTIYKGGASQQIEGLLSQVIDGPTCPLDSSSACTIPTPPPRMIVTYGNTDPTASASATCTFPQQCLRHGLTVVRSVSGLDVGTEIDYRFDVPRRDAWGRGFLGFDTMREVQPGRPWQRVTTFDNTTVQNVALADGTHRVYPNAHRPNTITTVVPLVTEGPYGATAPASGPGRITQMTYAYTLQTTNSGIASLPLTYMINRTSAGTSEWEDTVTASGGPFDPSAPFGIPIHPNYGDERNRSTQYTYDAYGNVTTLSTSAGQPFNPVVIVGNVQYTYEYRPAQWRFGLAHSRQANSYTSSPWSGAPPPLSTTIYSYESHGALYQTFVEPTGGADLAETITNRYDAQGRLTSQVAAAANELPRSQSWAYNDISGEGVYPSESWDGSNIATFSWVHPALGVLEATMDANGATTTSVYDDLGRVMSTTPPGGDTVTYGYGESLSSTSGAVTGTSMSSFSLSGKQTSQTLDAFGKVTLAAAAAFDGSTTLTLTSYDVFERPYATTVPASEAISPYALVTTYDSLGRVLSQSQPSDDGYRYVSTNYAYALFQTTKTDPVGRVSQVLYDAAGRPISSAQQSPSAATLTTLYNYGPNDTVVSVQDPFGNVITSSYDIRRRRQSIVDPDAASENDYYNGYGEVREVDSPTGSTVYTRDASGRITLTYNPDGWTQYLYDWPGNGGDIGKLAYAFSPDGTGVMYTYDSIGRPIGESWWTQSYWADFQQGYDALGRPSSFTYPATDGGPQYVLATNYNAFGYPSSLDLGRSYGTAAPTYVNLVTLAGTDPAGDPTVVNYGDAASANLTYSPSSFRLQEYTITHFDDPLADHRYWYADDGRLTDDWDAWSGREQAYKYDTLGRMTDWWIWNGTGSSHRGYTYADSGNLTDVSLSNPTWGAAVPAEHNNYAGPSSGSRPHALSDRMTGVYCYSGSWSSVACSPSATYCYDSSWYQVPCDTTYQYDSRGRVVGSSDGLSVTYRETNLPNTVTKNWQTTTFYYAADKTRVLKQSTSGAATASFGHGRYERRVGAGSTGGDLQVFVIPGVAQVEYDTGTGTDKTEYLHNDTAGSLLYVTEADGTADTPAYHEPFGKRTFADGTPVASFASTVRSGFGTHDYDDELGYINMKGRIYDPSLRRFLTPDPLVTGATNLQAYNRYSYVDNDPVNAIDPNGYRPVIGLGVSGGASAIVGSVAGSIGFTLGADPAAPDGQHAVPGMYVGGQLGLGAYAPSINGSVDFSYFEDNHSGVYAFMHVQLAVFGLEAYVDPTTGNITGWTFSIGTKGLGSGGGAGWTGFGEFGNRGQTPSPPPADDGSGTGGASTSGGQGGAAGPGYPGRNGNGADPSSTPGSQSGGNQSQSQDGPGTCEAPNPSTDTATTPGPAPAPAAPAAPSGGPGPSPGPSPGKGGNPSPASPPPPVQPPKDPGNQDTYDPSFTYSFANPAPGDPSAAVAANNAGTDAPANGDPNGDPNGGPTGPTGAPGEGEGDGAGDGD